MTQEKSQRVWMLSPASRARVRWDLLAVLMVLVELLVFPAQVFSDTWPQQAGLAQTTRMSGGLPPKRTQEALSPLPRPPPQKKKKNKEKERSKEAIHRSRTAQIISAEVWPEFALLSLTFWSCDISLNFLTGFHSGGELVLNASDIAKKYLRGWFFFDLLFVARHL